MCNGISPSAINYQLYYIPSYYVIYPDSSYVTFCPAYCQTTSSSSTIENLLNNAVQAWLTAVYGCTEETAVNYDNQANSNEGCIHNYGCTKLWGSNYDVNATMNDNSCILFGCNDSLADNYNIDAARLIAAANEGYPRNPIPVPSPGVGGYCLTKDPFLYASVNPDLGHAELSRLGRKVNEEAGRYPVSVLETFAYGTKRKVESLRVLLVGMAFKGNPETNDLRGSISVSIARELMQRGCNVECFDAVIGEQELRNHGLNPARMSEALSNSDAVLILNNHEKNIPIKFLQSVGSGRAVLVFDGWSLLERHEAEKYPGVIYANLGYMTKTDSDVIPPYSTKF